MRNSRSILNLVRVHSLAPRQFSTLPAMRQIERGKDDNVSHATGPSKVPEGLQEAVPKSVEDALPESIHPTSKNPKKSTDKSHAKNDGEESIVPKKVQEKLPEEIERAVPNAIHDTGDAPVTGKKG
ncbi:hypothetical protein NW752_011966 [Fusarium irregulare]|nr:hypothetical protein NW752_011966 [Fusarium irregulare]